MKKRMRAILVERAADAARAEQAGSRGPGPIAEPFEIAGVVIFCAMAQYKVLSTRRRTDRIGLDKAYTLEGAFSVVGLKRLRATA